jgi:hypothetical protein
MIQTAVNMTSDASSGHKHKIFWKGASENYVVYDKLLCLGRVRILIKTRLKVNFDRFTMEKMSNFIFNRVLISIRTWPKFIF